MSQVYKLYHVFVLMYELQVTKFYYEQSSYSHFIDNMRKILTLFSLDLRGIQYHHAGSKRADKEHLKKKLKKFVKILKFLAYLNSTCNVYIGNRSHHRII